MDELKTPRISSTESKKAYSSPILKNYGSVADLTLGGDYRGSDSGNCAPGNPDANDETNCS